MTIHRLAPLKIVAFRVTKLDACGAYDTGSCSMFASKSIGSIERTGETIDETEFPLVNADGDLEDYTSDAPRVKYLNLNIKLTKVVPELVNWMTGSDIIYDDAATPSAIGWRTQTNASANANYALEFWTRFAGEASCAGSQAYGYGVFPWIARGSFYEITHENALSDLVLMGQTRTASPWGAGPYSVALSEAVATLGHPVDLFEAVDATEDHQHFMRTRLAPPNIINSCRAVAGTMTVVDDDGAGAGLAATATMPTPLASTTPGYIDWGDGTVASVASGSTNATHTYATAGAKTVTYRPSAYSDVVYTGLVTMA